jgi:hypothetical protein
LVVKVIVALDDVMFVAATALITGGVVSAVLTGTICNPFTGARGFTSPVAPGVAVIVKPVPVTLNFT